MNRIITAIAILCFMLIIPLSGCSNSYIKQSSITLEKVDSSLVRVIRSFLIEREDGLYLKGDVKHRYKHRGNIFGHIHIEILSHDSEVIYSTNVKHYRNTGISNKENFSVKIPGNIPENSIIRIVHHDLRSHNSDKATWKGQ